MRCGAGFVRTSTVSPTPTRTHTPPTPAPAPPPQDLLRELAGDPLSRSHLVPAMMRLFGRPQLWGPVSNFFALLVEGNGEAGAGNDCRQRHLWLRTQGPSASCARFSSNALCTSWCDPPLLACDAPRPAGPAGFLHPPPAFPAEFGEPLGEMRLLFKDACLAGAR